MKQVFLHEELEDYPYPLILIRIDEATKKIVGRLLTVNFVREISTEVKTVPEVEFLGWLHWGNLQAQSIATILEDAGYKPIGSFGECTIHQLRINL